MTTETREETRASFFARHRNPILIAGLLAIVAAIAIWLLLTRFEERTADAYVEGNLVPVTSQVTGTVTQIGADDTDSVAAGAALVKLNASDAELALDTAKSMLAKAVRGTRVQYHQVSQTDADVASRENDVRKAQSDLGRRLQLVSVGAITGEEVAHSRDILANSRQALDAARSARAQRRAMVDNVSLRQHPDVLAAVTSLKTAYVALKRTTIEAPVGGTVSRRSVQVGQRITPGLSLMSIVPLTDIWVTANFKESQIRNLRIGQTVTLTADVYGDDVVYHGTIEGLSAGTGSAFALLPAQNATGNWIKVTQRVPVRVRLRADEIAAHPLRIGLSMRATADTTDRSGPYLSAIGKPARQYGTKVFDRELADADALVEKIIRANVGGARER